MSHYLRPHRPTPPSKGQTLPPHTSYAIASSLLPYFVQITAAPAPPHSQPLWLGCQHSPPRRGLTLGSTCWQRQRQGSIAPPASPTLSVSRAPHPSTGGAHSTRPPRWHPKWRRKCWSWSLWTCQR